MRCTDPKDRQDRRLCEKCRRETNEKAKERRRTRPLELRDIHLRNTFGLSLADFDAMLLAQGGRCAICRNDSPGGPHRQWHVDHEHSTGTVRGLLCSRCNTGIGLFRDDPITLQRAARYVVLRGAARPELQAPLLSMEKA